MQEKNFLKLNDISSYRKAYELSNYVWNIVVAWNHFERDTVGKQFARAIDSISTNIAEGFGRYTKKDKVNFYRCSYGSIKESLDWNEKSKARKMISDEQHQHILEELLRLPIDLHQLIKFTNERLDI